MTLTELQNMIATEYDISDQHPPVNTVEYSRRTRLLNEGVKKYLSLSTWVETLRTATLTINNQKAPLPADIFRNRIIPHNGVIIVGNNGYRLVQHPQAVASDAGDDFYCYISDNDLVFGGSVEDGAQCTISYQTKNVVVDDNNNYKEELSVGTDFLTITEPDYVVYYALKRLYSGDGDEIKAKMFDQEMMTIIADKTKRDGAMYGSSVGTLPRFTDRVIGQ